MAEEVDCGFPDTPPGSGAGLLTQLGPTLKVDIGFDPNYQPGIVPVAGVKAVVALVDTGATECCIDNLLAIQLGLPLIDKKPIAGVGGRQMANVYLAQIHVPQLRFTISGRFAGVDLIAGGQMHNALIGRTFLQHCTMRYYGKTGMVKIYHSR
jgi:predicted aspartyl protease